MYFDATPTNMVAVLVTLPAMVGVVQLVRKQYDTNLLLIFYVLALAFITSAGRLINPIVLYGGLGSAMLLRFEFMGSGFTKFVAFLALATSVVLIYTILAVPFSFR